MWLLLYVLLSAPKVIELTVRPIVAFVGDTLHVRCRIPPRDTNRLIEFGTDNVSSAISLDGSHAPITFERFIQHTDCFTTLGFCRLTDASGKATTRIQPLQILGCNNDDASMGQ